MVYFFFFFCDKNDDYKFFVCPSALPYRFTFSSLSRKEKRTAEVAKAVRVSREIEESAIQANIIYNNS